MEWKNNIEHLTLSNAYYRKVLYTTSLGKEGGMQLVLMNIKPREEIPEEVHSKAIQFIRVESGIGMAQISGRIYYLKEGDAAYSDL